MDETEDAAGTGIDRRRILQGIAAALTVTAAVSTGSTHAMAETTEADPDTPVPLPPDVTPVVAALIHPRMILQDLIGTLTELNILRCEVHLVTATLDPVTTDVRIPVTPTDTFDTCPRDVDVLFVPGGLDGTVDAMEHPATLDFLSDVGSRARWVTGVCTGTLLMGAAGLLRGYRATSHWYVRDLLPLFGARPVERRVVRHGNRLTGAATTSGLDLGLTLAALLRDRATAQRIQLLLEYAPEPPFHAGTPKTAPRAITEAILEARAVSLARAREVATRIGTG